MSKSGLPACDKTAKRHKPSGRRSSALLPMTAWSLVSASRLRANVRNWGYGDRGYRDRIRIAEFRGPHAPPRSPRGPSGKLSRQFLSGNRNSRYGESRARSAANRRAARRGRDQPKIGENAIPARLTDNPLISLETAKEKVWKSLEKFGKAWNFLGISLEKFGNPWKSLEKLGVTAKSLGSRR